MSVIICNSGCTLGDYIEPRKRSAGVATLIVRYPVYGTAKMRSSSHSSGAPCRMEKFSHCCMILDGLLANRYAGYSMRSCIRLRAELDIHTNVPRSSPDLESCFAKPSLKHRPLDLNGFPWRAVSPCVHLRTPWGLVQADCSVLPIH